MDTIRTYMNFSEPDPAHILTMADLEISIALASTLIVFDDERKLVAGLAEKWDILPPRKVRFKLRDGLKWSDGSPVTALQYKEALERAKAAYPDDLKALFEAVVSIEAIDSTTLVFTTKEEVSKSGILLKLTEPMYGLVSIKGGKLDLSKSAGPFFLEDKSKSHLTLSVNPNWYLFKKDMAAKVEIKRPDANQDVISSFESDPWANLVSGNSLMLSETSARFKKVGFLTWQRSLDKVFSFYPSKRFLKSGGASVIKGISQKLNREDLLAGLSGYVLANQFFPRGYELYSTTDPKIVSGSHSFQGAIKIIIPSSSFAGAIKEGLLKAVKQSAQVSVSAEIVPATEINNYMKRGDYDILATGIAVADPNFEGAMSFFIEREPAFIKSTEKPNDFADQLRAARSLPSSSERAAKMREIIVRAQEAGHVLPLFYFSSLAVAKPGIDLSQIPNSDETIPFAKVRMK